MSCTAGASAMPELYSRYLELLGTGSQLLPALASAVPAIGVYYFSMDYVKRWGRAGCMAKGIWGLVAVGSKRNTVSNICSSRVLFDHVDKAIEEGYVDRHTCAPGVVVEGADT